MTTVVNKMLVLLLLCHSRLIQRESTMNVVYQRIRNVVPNHLVLHLPPKVNDKKAERTMHDPKTKRRNERLQVKMVDPARKRTKIDHARRRAKRRLQQGMKRHQTMQTNHLLSTKTTNSDHPRNRTLLNHPTIPLNQRRIAANQGRRRMTIRDARTMIIRNKHQKLLKELNQSKQTMMTSQKRGENHPIANQKIPISTMMTPIDLMYDPRIRNQHHPKNDKRNLMMATTRLIHVDQTKRLVIVIVERIMMMVLETNKDEGESYAMGIGFLRFLRMVALPRSN